MLIDTKEERDQLLRHVQLQQLPSIARLIGHGHEMLDKSFEVDRDWGRRQILEAARAADQILEALTAVVEFEARCGKMKG